MVLLRERKLIKEQVFEENSSWVIAGFLRVVKNIGKLIFTNIEDLSGSIQALFFDREILELKKESILLIKGTLKKRKNVNSAVLYGEWELIVDEYEILSKALKVLPFEINPLVDKPLEPTRLKYRYLDLRRGLKDSLIKKSKILSIFRNNLLNHNFIEVNTPALSVSSQEGANTFDTIIEQDKSKYLFSLAQSPQLYKQLLMIGGLERYFQFANCFRLEDLRADRQYEFSQIDMEMAYASQEELFEIIESSLALVWKELKGEELIRPFPKISYYDALAKYGSDKPDLRYEYLIEDYTIYFPYLLNQNKHTKAFGLFIPNIEIFQVESKWIKSIVTTNQIYILKIENGEIIKSSLLTMDYPEYGIEELGTAVTKGSGTLLLVTCDDFTFKNALTSMGAMRMWFSKRPKAELAKEFKFAWIVDWPLFEYNEARRKWTIAHHLFTKPASNSTTFEMKTELSRGYDLVLNGIELASGSERNNDLEVQHYVFKMAGLSNLEIESSFGWFLEAFNYGVPPHMGIAIGIDRLIQLLLGVENIREVIAFPKNNHGICPLTGAPKIVE
ncbi:aspartate--tRNA ligase [Candidatus Mycoplasma haematobovis]|uniref:Aspartate--tRNA ligase n=1 Tax=Candidatus Mycoplasma haematobovis TaxID=432608 RepID=A0A1A9QES3_9MOLU|nr:aspartate--tRNA ligase [Candidatus Mycoplasma haematobovis]OAL10748.1 aspartate--tRNA ligase [Candidatus Mycoplasma haematobovis]